MVVVPARVKVLSAYPAGPPYRPTVTPEPASGPDKYLTTEFASLMKVSVPWPNVDGVPNHETSAARMRRRVRAGVLMGQEFVESGEDFQTQ